MQEQLWVPGCCALQLLAQLNVAGCRLHLLKQQVCSVCGVWPWRSRDHTGHLLLAVCLRVPEVAIK